MVVKDEAETIGRCLASARPFIDRYCIVDTGSTDGTPDTIRKHLADLPGEIHDRPWVNFGHNRTELARLAKGQADYLLLLDADLTIEHDGPFPALTGACYSGRVKTFYDYDIPILIDAHRDWEWRGVAHCWLHCDDGYTQQPLPGLIIRDHGHTTRAKLERDLEALSAEHARNPQHPRTAFYLAQTYKDLGRTDEAIQHYRVRAHLRGGNAEETYFAQYQLGALLVSNVSFAEGAPELLKAWQMRPHRAEALRALSRSAWNVADKIPYPAGDILFVQPSDYPQRNRWDDWRSRYQTLTVADHQAAYDDAFDADRDQRRFDADTLRRLLDRIGEPVSVIELGGWDGELAKTVLASTNGQVKRWRNYEISPKAVEATVCDDRRYQAYAENRFYWDARRRADLFVASHVIEHLSLADVRRTLDATSCRYVFLQAPLEPGPTDWRGYDGGHVLEVGWDGLDHELAARGFAPIPDLQRDTVRCYEKEPA